MLLANLFNLVFVLLLTEIYLMFDVTTFKFPDQLYNFSKPGLV